MVAAAPNEFQLAARTAADALEPRQRNAADEPDDFKAAYEAGKKAIASANAARIAMPAAEQNNPATAADLRRQFQTSADNARHYFRLATTLVDDDTDLAQLNEVRYFLCWLHWDNQDYYQAAILGEFLARRYPDHPAAAASAKLAMAAYERLYQAALAADAESAAQADATDFEARKMADVAEFITRRWPESSDADAAFSLLITYAIRNNQIERAEQMLAEASPQHRAQLELQLGNAMWGHYLEQANLAPAERPDPAVLDSLKKTAIGHLQTGFDNARKARSIDESTATGALFLAQALLADGKHQEAIGLLEQEEVGPLTLVKNSDPAAGRLGFAVETYKAALRAYVTASPPQVERALEMMHALEALAETNGDAESDDLLRIYLGLGMALRQQIDDLRTAGRDAEANQVTEAFVQFLDQLSARPGGSWASRQWIAQVYYTLGEQALTGAEGADQARRYFNKAATAYRQLLDSAKSGSSPPPNVEAALLAQKQLGDCLRQAGEYAEALDLYSAVLKEKESWLAVQFAAAMAYQERGQAEGNQWLERAIYGGYQLKSTGKNRIWGWLKLAQVADRAARTDPKYSDMFFEARLNAARCRFLIGLQSEGPARAQNFATAQQNIRSMEQLFPDFGGPRWKQEFDELSKQIKRAADSESTQ
jgi:tetratricopeptide (TPR) repeat protein